MAVLDADGKGGWTIAAKGYTLHIYRDRSRHWRWTLIARNGRKVACSGEGYQRRRDLIMMTYKIFPWFFAVK